ncbi:MAG: bifunctional phosphopantothenoylcysteine decarboxylase/phosphopantothenate--cysteine ligase CoaBC [Sulfobacillus acidophilus]|uniref:Coenzyme A biosynthesis bifunctional protein CoaBC n=1 Tax=Sulfobacillus acidophilus TaxID=53633 RepID=A0A2T2WEX7_9FIRM|nr:MAG: bifunctional phosphopantothenoylcysteine decarboxylase/phosphopantothenate--cysteine ligase CoaBC [Sulfobacillus acidophilus]
MRIVVGVAGGIAAYKTCELVSRLVQAGHEVRVIMTSAATAFVGPLTFEALSGHPVSTQATDVSEGPLSHITLAHWAEAMVVAPATAGLIARFATGRAEDMLSLVYLGFRGPVLVAPAMEPDMWTHPRTEMNVGILRSDGVHIVGPREGRMASGREGIGRMAEPWELMEALEDVITPQDLAHVRMVVTAGSTWEHFDPVRLLTNPSTGLMGVLIANAAARRGAHVHLITGPAVQVPVHHLVTRSTVTSAVEMLQAVEKVMEAADVFVGAAAVSDFRPVESLTHKMHKESLPLTWKMQTNPDIIAMVAQKYHGHKLIVGFAAETQAPVEQAALKLRKKGLDAIVANLVGHQEGFGSGQHHSWLVTAQGAHPIPGDDKACTANVLLDWIERKLKES